MFSSCLFRRIIQFAVLIISLGLAAAAGAGDVPAGYFAYIAQSGSNSVARINLTDWIVDQTISVGTAPEVSAADPKGRYVFTASFIGNNVARINMLKGEVDMTIAVGGGPSGLVFSRDGATVYATNYDDDTVSVIDVASGTVTATVNVGDRPIGLDITPSGDRVFVANAQDNNVSVIDTASNTETTTISVQTWPKSVAVDPGETYVYVVNADSHTVSRINLSNYADISTISVGSAPSGIAVTPDGRYVYVTNSGGDTVSRIVAAAGTVDQTISVGDTPHGIAASPDSRYVLVVNQLDATVSMIDVASGSEAQTIYVGGNPFSLGKFIGWFPPQPDPATPSGGPPGKFGGGGNNPPPMNPGGQATKVTVSPLVELFQQRMLPLANWGDGSGSSRSIGPAGTTPGLVYQLTDPDGEATKSWLPLSGNGTMPNGLNWASSVRYNNDVQVVDLDLYWSPRVLPQMALGRWTAAYWFQTEAGVCSNKRWEYLDIGPNTIAAHPVKAAPEQLTFNLLLSVFSRYTNHTTRVQFGLVQVFTEGIFNSQEDIVAGYVSIKAPYGKTSRVYLQSDRFDGVRTLRFEFENGLLSIYDEDYGDFPISYYREPDGDGYCLEYYRNLLYICNPGDAGGPIAGLLYGN